MPDINDPLFQSMGVEQEYDYAGTGQTFAERLGSCYHLGALAFVNWHERRLENASMPPPMLLVHGSWQGPGAPRRIDHCWVVLKDQRIWEPISAMVFDPNQFYPVTQGRVDAMHSAVDVYRHLLTTGHWGPWPEGF